MAEPKISLNKLGEYLEATPARRRRIILDQLNPEAYKGARYSDAREAITSYLADGRADEQQLIDEIDRLRKLPPEGPMVTQDRQLSADAIENFLDIADQVGEEGYNLEKRAGNERHRLNIAGVDVSIRPDLYIKDDNDLVAGAIKLYFTKGYPLSKVTAEYVASCLRAYMEETFGANQIDHRLCTVVDVPVGSVTQAPKAMIKRMKDITAACEEIGARWRDFEQKAVEE